MRATRSLHLTIRGFMTLLSSCGEWRH